MALSTVITVANQRPETVVAFRVLPQRRPDFPKIQRGLPFVAIM
jgi:hypothetical protein